MSYYWLNRKELMQKSKDRYHYGGGKEKAAEYYVKNRGLLKEDSNNKYRNFSEKDKKTKIEHQRNR